MRRSTAPDVKLSYGTIFKTIDAEMNAAGLRKDFFNLFFYYYDKFGSCNAIQIGNVKIKICLFKMND